MEENTKESEEFTEPVEHIINSTEDTEIEEENPIDAELFNEPKEKKYKITINKDVLLDFFLSAEHTPAHFEEVGKVINVVLIKHFSKHYKIFEDLHQYAWLAILERKRKQEFHGSKGSAYNYIYTTFRNEVGNNIIKMTKDTPMEDIMAFKEGVYDATEDDLPEEVKRYTKYLTGEIPYTFIRIPKKDVLPLLVFVRMAERKREVKVPEFIMNSKKSKQVLFKLLKEYFER